MTPDSASLETDRIHLEPLYYFAMSGVAPTSYDVSHFAFILPKDHVMTREDRSADEAARILSATRLPSHIQAQVQTQLKLPASSFRMSSSLNPLVGARHDQLAATRSNLQDNEERTLLYHAILDGSECRVRQLLTASPHLAITYLKGSQPLHYAVAKGNAAIVRLLLDSNADVHAKGQFGRLPLHLSVNGSTTTMLLEADESAAAISAQDEFGDTPLHLALKSLKSNGWDYAYDEVVKTLLTASANVNTPNSIGVTPFHYALELLPDGRRTHPLPKYSSLATLMLRFLELGANVLTANPSGKLPFYSLLNTSKYYLQSAFGQVKSLPRWNIHIQNTYRIIQLFLSQGADPYTKVSGKTLLHHLIENMTFGPSSDTRLLSLVCERINLNQLEALGCSPLHEALRRAVSSESPTGPAVINLLLSYGANADLTDSGGLPALPFLLKNGIPAIQILNLVQILIDGGASPFPPHLGDDLPIYLAARNLDGPVRKDVLFILLSEYDCRDWWSNQRESPLLTADQGGPSWLHFWGLACKAADIKEHGDLLFHQSRMHFDSVADLLPQDIKSIICEVTREYLVTDCLQHIRNRFYEIYTPNQTPRSDSEHVEIEALRDSFYSVIGNFNVHSLDRVEDRLKLWTGRDLQQFLRDANVVVPSMASVETLDVVISIPPK